MQIKSLSQANPAPAPASSSTETQKSAQQQAVQPPVRPEGVVPVGDTTVTERVNPSSETTNFIDDRRSRTVESRVRDVELAEAAANQRVNEQAELRAEEISDVKRQQRAEEARITVEQARARSEQQTGVTQTSTPSQQTDQSAAIIAQSTRNAAQREVERAVTDAAYAQPVESLLPPQLIEEQASALGSITEEDREEVVLATGDLPDEDTVSRSDPASTSESTVNLSVERPSVVDRSAEQSETKQRENAQVSSERTVRESVESSSVTEAKQPQPDILKDIV